jgi:hypothetical protein
MLGGSVKKVNAAYSGILYRVKVCDNPFLRDIAAYKMKPCFRAAAVVSIDFLSACNTAKQ